MIPVPLGTDVELVSMLHDHLHNVLAVGAAVGTEAPDMNAERPHHLEETPVSLSQLTRSKSRRRDPPCCVSKKCPANKLAGHLIFDQALYGITIAKMFKVGTYSQWLS